MSAIIPSTNTTTTTTLNHTVPIIPSARPPVSATTNVQRSFVQPSSSGGDLYVIDKSPYESSHLGWIERTAESGEVWFETFVSLVDPIAAKRKQTLGIVSSKVRNVEGDIHDFLDNNNHQNSSSGLCLDPLLCELTGGEANAKVLMDAYEQVEKSGMCYSREWIQPVKDANRNHIISYTAKYYLGIDSRARGSDNKFRALRMLPPQLVLLCLRPARIAKGQQSVLKEISIDLNCQAIVETALVELDAVDEYRNLRVAEEPYHFHQRQTACRKCVIFVARAISVLQFFNRLSNPPNTDIEPSLVSKIRACLTILNEEVRVDPKKAQQFLMTPNNEDDNADKKKEEETIHEKQEQRIEKIKPSKRRNSTDHKPANKRRSSGGVESKLSSKYASKGSSKKSTKKGATNHSNKSKDASSVTNSAAVLSYSSSDHFQAREEHGGDSLGLFTSPELIIQHQHLGKAIAQLKMQINMDPKELRKKLKEELRQELLQRPKKRTTSGKKDRKPKRRIKP